MRDAGRRETVSSIPGFHRSIVGGRREVDTKLTIYYKTANIDYICALIRRLPPRCHQIPGNCPMSDQDAFDRILVSLSDAMLEDARWPAWPCVERAGMDGAMAGRRTARWSGLSGRLGRPSWIPALAREGGLAGPRPRSVRESDASLPGSATRWRGDRRRRLAEPHGGCAVKPAGWVWSRRLQRCIEDVAMLSQIPTG